MIEICMETCDIINKTIVTVFGKKVLCFTCKRLEYCVFYDRIVNKIYGKFQKFGKVINRVAYNFTVKKLYPVRLVLYSNIWITSVVELFMKLW